MSQKAICHADIASNTPSKKALTQSSKELAKNRCFTRNYVHIPLSFFSSSDSEDDDSEILGISSFTSTSERKSELRHKAVVYAKQDLMTKVIDLLLRRGADPNKSAVPLTCLFLAVQNKDVLMVKKLLLAGADPNVTLGTMYPNCIRLKGTPKSHVSLRDSGLSKTNNETLIMSLECSPGDLTPLHFAVLLPGKAGVEIVRMLLEALADPNVRAQADGSFAVLPAPTDTINNSVSVEKKKCNEDLFTLDPPTDYAADDGRTPLHLACARDYELDHANEVVKLLLAHKADPNLLCNGMSPLALAIASGNDDAIASLLSIPETNASLPLGNGWGSTLCVAASTMFEFRRDITKRINLLEKLIHLGGVNPIDPLVEVPPKFIAGNVVDFIFQQYAQDRRISSVPYHALSPTERETFVARKTTMTYLCDKVREAAVRRSDARGSSDDSQMQPYLYCYECARSVGVRLIPCTRCRSVYYCSKNCKSRAWTSRHKEECTRLLGMKSLRNYGSKQIHYK
ncbi:Ankyrin repeat and MYND domain containing 1 [Cichlidogyrus casuarinus]|uniref:Ankyrin repeat and MYND domain containing 1 n=1 Tax=Cichlidogyrus casuarinus TaxID=1844966 RepID=A0ABD2QK00_9PLAT